MIDVLISILAFLSLALIIYLRVQGKLRLGFSVDKWTTIEILSGFLIAFVPVSMAFLIIWALGNVEIVTVHFQAGAFFADLTILTVAALAEEILFRVGLLLALIYLTKKVWLSIAIQILFFGIVHFSNPGADMLTVLSNSMGGLMYSLAFIYTGRIWMPFILHLFWNMSQGFYGFNISGLNEYSGAFIELNPIGNELISGGSYGLEGSLIGIGARILVIVFVLISTKKMAEKRPVYEKLKQSILPESIRNNYTEAEQTGA